MHRAATFIDYQNLYEYLKHRATSESYTDETILRMLTSLRATLQEDDVQLGLSRAYGDFSSLVNNPYYLQKNLYMNGVEVRFVPVALQKNTIDLRLCVDVMDVLHHRPEIDTFIIMTGDSDFVPLFQTLHQHGRRTYLVAFRERLSAELLRNTQQGRFMDARELLEDVRVYESATTDTAPTEFKPIAELPYGIDRDALEIIERHFGQYSEIYLTPLLRKLSEEMGDVEGHEPKSLIGDLENAGAIRLEKRRGVRYDYTVLILNPEHPDIIAVREEARESPVSGEELFQYGGDGDGMELDPEDEFQDEDWDEAEG